MTAHDPPGPSADERAADSPFFRPEHFRAQDETGDELFYSQPRFVRHLDEAAIAALTQYYARLFRPGPPSWI